MPAWLSSPRRFFQKSIDTAQAAGLPSEPPPLLRAALATHFLLAGASAAELDALVGVCAPLRLAAGARLFPLAAAAADGAGAASQGDDGAAVFVTSGGRALAPGPRHTCFVLTDGALVPDRTTPPPQSPPLSPVTGEPLDAAPPPLSPPGSPPSPSPPPGASAGLVVAGAAKCLNPLGLVGGGGHAGTDRAVVDLVAASDGAVRLMLLFFSGSRCELFGACAPLRLAVLCF